MNFVKIVKCVGFFAKYLFGLRSNGGRCDDLALVGYAGDCYAGDFCNKRRVGDEWML